MLTPQLLVGTLPGVIVGSVIRVELLPGPQAFYAIIALVLIPLGTSLDLRLTATNPTGVARLLPLVPMASVRGAQPGRRTRAQGARNDDHSDDVVTLGDHQAALTSRSSRTPTSHIEPRRISMLTFQPYVLKRPQDSRRRGRYRDMNPATVTDDRLRAPVNFARAVLDALPDATAILDQSGTIVSVNHAWRMFTADNNGRPEDTGVGVSYLDVCRRAAAQGCDDAVEVLAGLQAVLAGDTVESDREYPCPSPTVGRWFSSRITPIRHPGGGAVVAHVNISRRKLSEQELTHLASHDSLTGLPNRRLFNDQLAAALDTAASRPDMRVGLLYIDLDDFKPINDTYGHDAGDEVLLSTAHRLRQNVRLRDTVARLGGDEFAVCAPAISADELSGLADRLRSALAQPQQIHGRQTYVRGSIGVHLAVAGDSAAETIRLADVAMYAVKHARPIARLEPTVKSRFSGGSPQEIS